MYLVLCCADRGRSLPPPVGMRDTSAFVAPRLSDAEVAAACGDAAEMVTPPAKRQCLGVAVQNSFGALQDADSDSDYDPTEGESGTEQQGSKQQR